MIKVLQYSNLHVENGLSRFSLLPLQHQHTIRESIKTLGPGFLHTLTTVF